MLTYIHSYYTLHPEDFFKEIDNNTKLIYIMFVRD